MREENILELLSSGETEELDEYTVYRFDAAEHSYDDVYEAGEWLEAKVIGREKSSDTYFISLSR